MVDHDEIRNGRRRDWWKRREAERQKERKKLPPIDEMERLLKEEGDSDLFAKRSRRQTKHRAEKVAVEDAGLPGPPPDPALLEPDDDEKGVKKRRPYRTRFDIEHEQARIEWQRTRRQLLVLAVIVGGGLFVFFTFFATVRIMSGAREKEEVERLMRLAETGGWVDDISTPPRALATLRSAWLRGDMSKVWEITTSAIRRDVLAARSEREHLADQADRYRSGGYQDWVDILQATRNPHYVREPRRPYKAGDLAAFLTPPVTPQHANQPVRHVVAFVHVNGKWLFFKATPESSWNRNWRTIYEAKPGATIEHDRRL